MSTGLYIGGTGTMEKKSNGAMQKIMIIGYSGSGKSTLAQRLGERYECEVLHLDCVHWLPGWTERGWEEMSQLVSGFMDTHDCWIMDGNYQSACYERRMKEATQIIFLKFPVHICLYRVVKRYLMHRGKNRNSMTEGCDEKIDREFLWWILHEGRNRAHRERYRKVCEEYRDKTVVLKNPRTVKRFMRT